MNPPVRDDLDLVISRLLAVPRDLVWRAWSDTAELEKWFCPKPWRAEFPEFDMCPGGAFFTRMFGPDGEQHDWPGCFLDVVPRERIVLTSVLGADWRPLPPPMIAHTAYITMTDEAGGTRYTAQVLHADKESRDQHDAMGFQDGWGTVISQLEEVAKTY